MVRMSRRLIIGIILAILGCRQMQVYADEADVPETVRMEDVSHYEWEDVCIYARDVAYTLEDLEKMIAEGSLEQNILADTKIAVRIAPQYNLCADALERADIRKVQAGINEAGYEVRLFIKNRSEYINIKLEVYQTEQEIADREVLESHEFDFFEQETAAKPEIVTEPETPVESKTEDREQVPSYSENKERGDTKNRMRGYTMVILGLGTIEFIWVKKDIHVIVYHSRRKKERLAKRKRGTDHEHV